VAFLDRVKDQPFFLYLPFNAVHTPLHVVQRYLDRFPSIKDERHRTLAAMTSAMDDAIGAVLNKLRATGQFDNTVIVFISDNGSPTYTRAGSNAPLNGGKITYYEGGIRVPFIIRAPQLKPSVYRHPVVSRDLLPTFLNLAGVPLPKDREYDGVDLIPYLKGEAKAKPHDVLCWRSLPAKAIRKGDWKLIEVGDSFTRLYDLSSDIGEKTDLSGQKPEIVKQLRAAYADWESKMVKPKWDVRSSEVVPVNDERIKWSV
jgi:arylsulfatase A-like enzyme